MKTLLAHITNNEFSPVYLLFGSERYLVTQYRAKLKDAILNGDDGMNFNSFEGKNIDWTEVISIAQTLPFFSDRRLILLDNTGIFKSSGDYEELFTDLPESTHLIFCETEVNKKTRTYQTVAKLGTASELNGPDETQLKQFIAKRLGSYHKRITVSDVTYLLDTVGPDMLTLCNEIEKLSAYTGDRDIITRQDIDTVCIQQISGKIFQLTEAIAMKDKIAALNHYNTITAMRERPLYIMFHIIRHFNILLQVKELAARGENNNSIAALLGLKTFVAGKYRNQAANFTLRMLRTAVEYGTELEAQVKSSRINEKIAIEFLLVRLISS